MDCLAWMKIPVAINLKPQEVADPKPFDQDSANCTYDPVQARRFWRILILTSKVVQQFRSKFVGKCSPVHFFWGSFDLACTRFSGRVAPPRKGVITGPAYSHEEASVGFWPGGGAVDGPAFYSYFAPSPQGLDKERIGPAAARWNTQLSEFILMYDDVRAASAPEELLYEFFESTYAAGTRLAKWDRAALEI
ncbi:MAG TPA: DUF5996 family protein [Bryobacteraceae bacterium]